MSLNGDCGVRENISHGFNVNTGVVIMFNSTLNVNISTYDIEPGSGNK